MGWMDSVTEMELERGREGGMTEEGRKDGVRVIRGEGLGGDGVRGRLKMIFKAMQCFLSSMRHLSFTLFLSRLLSLSLSLSIYLLLSLYVALGSQLDSNW